MAEGVLLDVRLGMQIRPPEGWTGSGSEKEGLHNSLAVWGPGRGPAHAEPCALRAEIDERLVLGNRNPEMPGTKRDT